MGLINIAVAFTAVARKNEGLLRVLSEEMIKHEINTPLRVCHFLSQLSHESAGFTVLSENLNYSSTGLLKNFSKYFKDGSELKYARNPKAIASRVYANRMGNGSEDTEEGWRYRGRGYIQITGKFNYEKYSKSIFGDSRLLENPDLALDYIIAAKIACAFWKENNLNSLADKDDLIGITKKINGGTNGIDHRRELLKKAKDAVGI
jgi:putative chitinase